MVLLFPVDGPFTFDWATGWWCGRRVGLRWASEAVIVGSLAELCTFLDALDMTWVIVQRGENSAAAEIRTPDLGLKIVRVKMFLDADCTDIVCELICMPLANLAVLIMVLLD